MSDKPNRLDSQFSLMGAFWLPDAPDVAQSGTLSSNEHKIIFSTAPDYSRRLKTESISGLLSFRPGKRVPAMHGYVEGFPCTLCEVLEVDRPGITDFRHGQALSAVSYRAAFCICGIQLDGPDDRCLTSTRFTFTCLNEWLPSGFSEDWDKDGIAITIPAKEREFTQFSIPPNGITVWIRMRTELRTVEEAGRVARSIVEVEVGTREPESLSWYLDVGNRLENLFSLLVGSSLTMQAMFVHRGEESGTVIMKRHNNPQPFDMLACVHLTASQVAYAIAIWLSEPPRFRSVENVALGVLRRGKLFIETEFLSLTQSLEGFHRATTKATKIDKAVLRRVRKEVSALLQKEGIGTALQKRICAAMMQAVDPTFKARVTELCEQLTSTMVMRMGILLPDFVDDVANSRNFLTHTGKSDLEVKKKPAMTIEGLLSTNQRLRALLRAVLLQHVGVPESQFSEVVMRIAMQQWY